MKIAVAQGMSFEEFVLTELQEIADVDILILKYGIIPSVSFSAEMTGETRIFSELCLLSKNLNCALMAVCDTDLYGARHKSAAIVNAGELVDVIDLD